MDSLHILVDNQFGFRSGHSTTLALLQLYNKISSAIDLNEFTIGIFLDLSKAFDTVNHSIVFDKLVIDSNLFSSMGCTKKINLFIVVIKNKKNKPIYCGVPEGSILAPLLFLLIS
jgi:hypothetical protein